MATATLPVLDSPLELTTAVSAARRSFQRVLLGRLLWRQWLRQNHIHGERSACQALCGELYHIISFQPEEPREAGAIFTHLGCEKRGDSDNPRVPSACTLEPHRIPGLTRPATASLTASPGCAPRPPNKASFRPPPAHMGLYPALYWLG